MMQSTEGSNSIDDTNNNFDNNQQNQDTQHNSPGLSKAELRKSNKPIMEKKRRARINNCLNELKTLILDAMKKDPTRHTKLEKADILEMTVKHLQTVQRSQSTMSVQSDPTVLHKFKAGFSDCTEEVNRYINKMDGVEHGVKQRLIGHLNTCAGGLQQMTPFSSYGTSNYRQPTVQYGPTHSSLHSSTGTIPLTQDINNNGGRIQMGGVQLIPSRLPTGELALVMPNSSNLPYFPQSTFPNQNPLDLNLNYPRISAFNSVTKTQPHNQTNSPPLSPVSSISSCDDSLPLSEYHSMTITPPLQTQQNLVNIYPTPPSGGSAKLTGNSVTVQQPHITSTTELLKIKPLSVITNTNSSRSDVQYVNKKRPYPIELSDNLLKLAPDQPTSKTFKSDKPAEQNQNDRNNDTNGDMWRPW